jgi:hypothetical protein
MGERHADLGRYDDWWAWLATQGETDPDVRVVYVGGSAVTGGFDEHSDLDVEVLATPGTAVATYHRLLRAASRDFEVHHVWELPGSTYPDGRQAFLGLTVDAGDLTRPTRIVDLHVCDLADEHRLVDERRHGAPLVVHDPDGLVELRHDDEQELERARREAVVQTSARRPIAEWLVSRALARGDVVEANAFHVGYGVTPLVRLLRIRHCPARHDFGLRYLRTDLPPGYAARVAALLEGDDLQARAVATFAWQDELLAELGPVDVSGQSHDVPEQGEVSPGS